MEVQTSTSCKNCGTPLSGPFCSKCGQRQITQRWSVPVLSQQFIHQLTNIEKGFLFTVKALFVFPGKMMRDYWQGKTVIYYNPFRYLLIWTTINLLISFWLGIDDMLQAALQPASLEASVGVERLQSADQQFDSWMNFLVLLLIPVISWVTLLLFKKKGYNYAEHLIMNAFIFGQQALLSTFTQFIFYFFPILFSAYFGFYFLLGLLYNTYVFTKTFREPWWIVLIKALVIGIAGILTLFLLVGLFSVLAIAIS